MGDAIALEVQYTDKTIDYFTVMVDMVYSAMPSIASVNGKSLAQIRGLGTCLSPYELTSSVATFEVTRPNRRRRAR